jgi:hypothetical protein
VWKEKKQIINKLRTLAVLVIVTGLIPDALTPIIDDILNGSATQFAYKLVFSEKKRYYCNCRCGYRNCLRNVCIWV